MRLWDAGSGAQLASTEVGAAGRGHSGPGCRNDRCIVDVVCTGSRMRSAGAAGVHRGGCGGGRTAGQAVLMIVALWV